MERFYIIAPAIIPAAFMITMFAYFSFLVITGRKPEVEGVNRRKFSEIIGPHLTSYFIWLIRPIEGVLVKAHISPNLVTGMSLGVCAISGIALANGFLAFAAWMYILAGALDVLDGRVARRTNCSSQSGAFIDSVFDRWGELFVFAGMIWFLRDSAWLAAAMLAAAGSMMVSYTRARGEGLGLALDGGTMQRAERIFIVAVGTIAAAWFSVGPDTAAYGQHILGAVLAIVGVGSTLTSIGRWWAGYRALVKRESSDADAADGAADQPGESDKVAISSESKDSEIPQPDTRAA